MTGGSEIEDYLSFSRDLPMGIISPCIVRTFASPPALL